MSGRGGPAGRGGRGGRGGWAAGRGVGPVAKDDDGNIIDSRPDGPPPVYPEITLPAHPEIQARTQLLLIRRNDFTQAAKTSPFFLELKDTTIESVEDLLDKFKATASAAPGTTTGQHGAKKRKREPLTSVIKLLPEYFPDELYSNADRRHAKLGDTYFKRAAQKGDLGLSRLEALAQMEKKAEAAGGAREEEEQEQEVEPLDEDDEEDMNDDDYYQGADFDDDEEYDADFDDGGGDEPIF